MSQILILADDLSGAADCANACMHSGMSAAVSFGNARDALACDVLSIDCDTRHLAPDEAAKRVREITRLHLDIGQRQIVFKKVDSTLRGNVGSEIRAVLEEQRRGSVDAVAILAPAFPSGGRTTLHGCQFVHGTPLHQTETWKNDCLPGVAHMPSMLNREGLRTHTIDLELLHGGQQFLVRQLRQIATKVDVLICDAETDEDLRAIARASFSLGQQTVWAGSAGLAYQLPHAAALAGSLPYRSKPQRLHGPMLFVVGSISAVAHRQARLLEHSVRVRTVCVSPRLLLSGNATAAWAETAGRIASSLASGDDTLVILDPAERVDIAERRLLTDALGAMLALSVDRVGALIATGGETARAILNSWNISLLHVVGEVDRGVPCSIVQRDGRTIPVLTKAGSFGEPEALLRCWQYLVDLSKEQQDVPLRNVE